MRKESFYYIIIINLLYRLVIAGGFTFENPYFNIYDIHIHMYICMASSKGVPFFVYNIVVFALEVMT